MFSSVVRPGTALNIGAVPTPTTLPHPDRVVTSQAGVATSALQASAPSLGGWPYAQVKFLVKTVREKLILSTL